MHAWYSNKHDLQCGCAVFQKLNSTGVVAATFTCEDKERGELYINSDLSQFDDYVYIGKVGMLACEDGDDTYLSPSWEDEVEEDEVWEDIFDDWVEEAVCEGCGVECEYDPVVCLCPMCLAMTENTSPLPEHL